MSSSKPTRDPTSTTCIEDYNIVAYMKMKGWIAIPWVSDDENLRVAFDIQGDQQQAEEEMQGYHNGEMVNVYEYVRYQKDVKTQAYNLKQIYQKRRV
jgi:hypothetical protein